MRPRVLKECGFCGAEHKVYQAELDRGWGEFCSRVCRQKARRSEPSGKCVLCENPIALCFSKLIRGWGRFCSRECSDLARDKKNGNIGLKKAHLILDELNSLCLEKYAPRQKVMAFKYTAEKHSTTLDCIYRLYMGMTYSQIKEQ